MDLPKLEDVESLNLSLQDSTVTSAEMVDVVQTTKVIFSSFAVKLTKNHARTMKLAEHFGLVDKVLTRIKKV